MTGDSVRIGSVEITSVSDGRVAILASELFPTIPDQAWEPYRHELTPDHEDRLEHRFLSGQV